MTDEQSHEEIQAILRKEIDTLRLKLEECLDQMAALTGGLAEGGGTSLPKIDELVRRHRLEIALLHAKYAVQRMGRIRRSLLIRRQAALLGKSDLFDATWYLRIYGDVASAGMTAQMHYARSGAFEGRDPGPDFSTIGYYMANPDVAEQGWPALVHYESLGKSESRSTA